MTCLHRSARHWFQLHCLAWDLLPVLDWSSHGGGADCLVHGVEHLLTSVSTDWVPEVWLVPAQHQFCIRCTVLLQNNIQCGREIGGQYGVLYGNGMQDGISTIIAVD